MNKKRSRLIAWCTAAGLVISQGLFAGAAFAESKQADNTKRIFGADRYQTAIEISKEGWTKSDYAVLARGDDFADALSAAPLAKAYGAPLLLTETNRLTDGVLAQLKELGVKNVFIAGGTGAVSKSAEDALAAEEIAVDRLGGLDRYETSVEIAKKVQEKLGAVTEVALASGEIYADALSVSSIAAAKGMPILLTEKSNLPDGVREYIGEKKTYVIGGNGVISDEILSSLAEAERLGGIDRFETNLNVMKKFENNIDFTNIFLAVGYGPNNDEFADALAGSAYAAGLSSPVVLVYKTVDSAAKDYLVPKVQSGAKIITLGGTAVVPQSIVNELLENPAPVVKNEIPDLTLPIDEEKAALKLDEVFEDIGSDTLTYTAESNNPEVAAVKITDGILEVTPAAKGQALVVVTAEDSGGNEASTFFNVIVVKTYMGDEVKAFVEAQDFGVMNSSGVKGYSVGFRLPEENADKIVAIQVTLLKGDTPLAFNVNTPKLLEEYRNAQSLSTPFDIEGNYSDDYWVYGKWQGEKTDVPTKAVIAVADADLNFYIVENTNLTGNPEELFAEQGTTN